MLDQIKCPECDAIIVTPDNVEVGEVIVCPECSIELEVKNIDPMELVVAESSDEDWGE